MWKDGDNADLSSVAGYTVTTAGFKFINLVGRSRQNENLNVVFLKPSLFVVVDILVEESHSFRQHK